MEVIEIREKIANDTNQGIYVRDSVKGSVRSIFGEAYMLEPQEDLWDMDLGK